MFKSAGLHLHVIVI